MTVVRYDINDPNIRMHFLTDIARSFSGYITGTGAANSLAIFNPELDVVKEQTDGKSDSNSPEKIIYDLSLDVISRIVDSSFGAFHVHDILNNPYTFSGVNGNIKSLLSMQDYLMFLYESSRVLNDSENLGFVNFSESDIDSTKSPFSGASMKELLKHVPPINFAAPASADSTSVSVNLPSPPAASHICNESPTSPSLANPALSAIVIKEPALSMQAKNSHFLSVFFNAIPPIEMSKCVPYISLTFYEKNFANGPDDFLNQTAYFRFNLKDDLSLDDNAFKNLREINAGNEDLNAQATFMNIFTSPGTMNNGDINSEISGLFADEAGEPSKIKKGRVLEPFAPMLTLNRFDVSTTSGGYGVTTSRRANMSLYLHDRSRLKEVAPLISINQLVQTTVKIEFGWSHPDSSVFNNSDGSQNQIGIFLNSLRDVQFYSLNTSNVSLKGPGAEIKLKLSAFGYVEKNVVPASCGKLAPLSLVNTQVVSAIDKLISDAKEKENITGEKDVTPSIHQPLKVLRKSVTSGYAAVDAVLLRELLTLIRSGTADPANVIKQVFLLLGFSEDEVNTLGLIPGFGNDFSNFDKPKIKELLSRFNATSIAKNNFDEIMNKLDYLFISSDYFRSPRAENRKSDINKRLYPEFTAASGFPPDYDTDKIDGDGIERISLGSLMLEFVGAPMLSTGQFSEVQMIFYPINHKAGGARIHTTASLPIKKDTIKNAFEKLKNEEENTYNANFTASSIVDFFADLILSESDLYYGTASQNPDPNDGNPYFLESAAISEELKRDDLLKKISATFEIALKDYQQENGDTRKESELKDEEKDTIAQAYFNKVVSNSREKALASLYDNDGLEEVDVNSLVKPFITAKFETLPAINPNPLLREGNETSELGKLSGFLGLAGLDTTNTGYYDSSKILRIHVFDTNMTSNPSADLVKDVLHNVGLKTAGESITQGGSDGNNTNLFKDLKARINGDVSSGKVKVADVSSRDLKMYVKRQFPSITYGATNSTVKDISIESSTSDSIAQAFAIEAEVAKREGRTTKGNRANSSESEVTVFPANIRVEMLGMPFIAMGNQIYVDLGTDTDLDNVYIVNSVTHNLGPGLFTTSCDLKLQNQGMTRNLRGDISKAIEKLVAE